MQTGGKSVAKSFALICSHGAGMGGLGKPREYQAIMSGHPPSQAEKEDIEVVATPLHLAASLDDVDQAQAILANTHGFLMLEARDSDGHTPLIIAVRYNSPGVAGALLEAGARPAALCPQGQTALMYAIDNDLPHLAFKLIERDKHESHLGKKDSKGLTALHHCAKVGNSQLARSLLQTGLVEVDDQDKFGATPLYHALKSQNNEVAQALLEHKASITVTGWDEKSLLHLVSEQGNHKMLAVLLKSQGQERLTGRQLDSMTDLQENNPLHSACLSGSLECVRLLLRAGIDINATGMMGRPALRLALDNKNLEIFKLLIDGHASLDVVSRDEKNVRSLLFQSQGTRLEEFWEAAMAGHR